MLVQKRINKFQFIMVVLILLLINYTIGETKVEYLFQNKERTIIKINDKVSNIYQKIDKTNFYLLNQSQQIGEWKKTTVSYNNLQISYFMENDKIYHLRALTNDWYINDVLKVGEILTSKYIATFKPIKIPNGFLFTYSFLDDNEIFQAHCVITVNENNIIQEIVLSLALN